ncbi:terminal uridylyltransferase Tailor-like [Adelges cooleyi]|uniref:terminal uridylyltransferase Tailor-like n=1 Tax=Adelges cooleyi TaxID=133065 RepID=UPI00217FA24E|nr:terminal uridylyltransferase Tailor-like [Adelges cooleyi]
MITNTDTFCEIFGMTKQKLCRQIDNLMVIMDQTYNDNELKQRIDAIKLTIQDRMKINSGFVYVFGSRVYKLATTDSDLDLYFDVGGCFTGKIADSRIKQLQLVDLFIESFEKSEDFINIVTLKDARVPIVRFRHKPTNLKCDLSFRSGLTVRNSSLVKLYLSLDKRVQWVVCVIVKQWALTHELINDNLSSFAIIWLVLFVLIRQKVVPPTIEFWKMSTKHEPNFVEGWDTSICVQEIRVPTLTTVNLHTSKWDLLRSVFEFYSDTTTLKNYVLCPVLGQLIPKSTFYKDFLTKSSSEKNFRYQREMFGRTKTIVDTNFGCSSRIEIQNPIKLCNNVSHWLLGKDMNNFIDLCVQSAKCMK